MIEPGSRCLPVIPRRSEWARSAQSSPARFPTGVIGPLFREGTLNGWMLQQNASGAIVEWWFWACRGSVAVSAAASVTASAAASAKALVALTWGLLSATLSVLAPVLM